MRANAKDVSNRFLGHAILSNAYLAEANTLYSAATLRDYQDLDSDLRPEIDALIAEINVYDRDTLWRLSEAVRAAKHRETQMIRHIAEQEEMVDPKNGQTIGSEAWQRFFTSGVERQIRIEKQRVMKNGTKENNEALRQTINESFGQIEGALENRRLLYVDLRTAQLDVLRMSALRIIAIREFLKRVEQGTYKPKRLRAVAREGRHHDLDNRVCSSQKVEKLSTLFAKASGISRFAWRIAKRYTQRKTSAAACTVKEATEFYLPNLLSTHSDVRSALQETDVARSKADRAENDHHKTRLNMLRVLRNYP